MAGLIRNEDIQHVRERVRMEDIVGAHVTLQRAGVGSLKGLCPFHDERTPSFHVRPQMGFYHCFGCGEGGDVIDFVMKINHLPFTEAVEYLAGQVGYALRYEDSGSGAPRRRQDPNRRSRLIAANRDAAEFYAAQLASPEASTGRQFLAERGFDRSVAEHFGVGYAPKGWTHLFEHLRKKGYTENELQTAGLVSQGRSGSYDRFRGRLIWPIRDTTGSVVGFGARKLYEDDPGPKYLNTPETPIYKKAQVLYGLDLAKREMAMKKRVVVVEGYTDVMAMHIAGEETAVATCGTAFGPDHIRVVRRIIGDAATGNAGVLLSSGQAVGGEIIFTFDGDEAGQKAALRAFAEDQRFGAQTFVAVEPSGMDPCDLRLAKGDEALVELVRAKTPLFEFAIESVIKDINLDLLEGRVAGLRAGAPVVAQIRDNALRGEYARRLAGWLGMDEPSVLRAVNSAVRNPQRSRPPQGRDHHHRGPARGPAGGPPTGGSQHGGNGEAAPHVRGPDPSMMNDPVVRLERQVLSVVLQLPEHALAAGFDDLGPEAFAVPAYRAVYDVIRAGGGVHAYGEQVAELTAQGEGSTAHAKALNAWAEQILENAGPVAPLITELAVTPLPHDQPDYVGDWARGVVNALARLVLTREIGELKARLSRTDPADDSYSAIFTELLEVEKRHRALSHVQ